PASGGSPRRPNRVESGAAWALDCVVRSERGQRPDGNRKRGLNKTQEGQEIRRNFALEMKSLLASSLSCNATFAQVSFPVQTESTRQPRRNRRFCDLPAESEPADDDRHRASLFFKRDDVVARRHS